MVSSKRKRKARRRHRGDDRHELPALALVAILVLVTALGGAAVLHRRSATDAIAYNPPPFSPAPAPTSAPSWLALHAPPIGKPMRVMFLGDSLSSGYYATTKAQGFPSLVAKELAKQHPLTVVKPERNYTYPLTIVRSFEQHQPENLDLAVIELGINDFQRTPDPKVFGVQYRQLLANIQRTSPHVGFLCLYPWLPTPALNKKGQARELYAKEIRQACRQVSGQVADLSPLYDQEKLHGPKGRPTFAGPSDLSHPNDAGHAEITKAILRALASPPRLLPPSPQPAA